ncbi:MAG: ATP-binding protein [Actinomycetia bacterium]|nr:ATP-binding protein [Actinomycetes bacterium]MCP4845234.1 ATP-binding protein [Actinomycetes bacterium]
MNQPALHALGSVYLPASGSPVGSFQFLVDSVHGQSVEIGTPVCARTVEGDVIGSVTDMATFGVGRDPVREDFGAVVDTEKLALVPDAVVATAQIFWSEKMRPVRAGLVHPATAEQVALATGIERNDWPVPAGVVPLADGSFAPVALDGYALAGPESGHMVVSGLSGSGKTSYISTILKSLVEHGSASESVGLLVFNVKGEDLIWLDHGPAEGYELTDHDLAIYESLGVSPTPFTGVEVWAPAVPGGMGTQSPRPDAISLRWSLADIFDDLRLFPGFSDMYADEKLASFIGELREYKINNPNRGDRIESFGQLDRWLASKIAEANDEGDIYAWRSHHVASLGRFRRKFAGLRGRCGGLLSKETTGDNSDIPTSGWGHGQVVVVDIAGLSADVQGAVIARVIDRLMRSAENRTLGVDHVVAFADELNQFAPAQGREQSQTRKALQKVATQGRYSGVVYVGACQKASKVDEMIRDQAATSAIAFTSEAELGSGAYGRLSTGLVERLVTQQKGQITLSHYLFRGHVTVLYPRPAFRTGRAKASPTAGLRPKVTESLGLSEASVERLTEGIASEDLVAEIIAGADDPQVARERLEAARVPDIAKVVLHEPSTIDDSDPFLLND